MVLSLLNPVMSPSPSSTTTTTTTTTAPTTNTSASTSASATPESESTTEAAGQQTSQPKAPEGVKFDFSDAALKQIKAAALSAETVMMSGSARSYGLSRSEAPAATSAGPVERSADAVDPTEEDRARAWAIRGMEREKLLNLVSTLNATPAANPAEKEVAEYAAAQPNIQIAPSSDRLVA